MRVSRVTQVSPRSLLTPKRLDVMALYLYATHRELGVEGGWARRLYANHMQHFNRCREPDGSGKAGLSAFLASFHSLLDSVKRDGYREDAPPIPVGINGIIVDGAHRLAACLLCRECESNCPVQVIRVEEEPGGAGVAGAGTSGAGTPGAGAAGTGPEADNTPPGPPRP